MKNNYKVPWHVRQFVKKELMDYAHNKKMMQNFKGDSRSLIIINSRLNAIDNVVDRLNEEDRKAFDMIFVDKYTQAGAEIAKHYGKDAYYRAMNKIIYLTAIELDMI